MENVQNGFAVLNVTWAGQNGELRDPVLYDSTDFAIKAMAAEAIRSGSVDGIRSDGSADLTDFVVERFPANSDRPQGLIMVRPKTPFGVLGVDHK